MTFENMRFKIRSLIFYLLALVLVYFAKLVIKDAYDIYQLRSGPILHPNLVDYDEYANFNLKPHTDWHANKARTLSHLASRFQIAKNSDKIVYIEKREYEGYGNRVYGVITGFLISLITNSTLIINWSHVDMFIQVPIDGVLLISDSSQWNSKLEKARHDGFLLNIHKETFNSWRVNKQFNKLVNQLPLAYNVYYIDMYYAFFMELATNPSYYHLLDDLVEPYILDEARDSFSDETMNNEEKMDKLLRVGFNLAFTVLNVAWTLKPSLQRRADEFYSRHFTDSYVIGIQLRFEFLNHFDDPIRMINCALSLELKQNTGKRVKWYISTDSSYYSAKMMHVFANKAITYNKGHIRHLSNGIDAYEKALIDNELLSRCDELIMTGGSTFAMISVFKRGRLPFYFEGRRGNTHCYRAKFNQLSTLPDGSAIV